MAISYYGYTISPHQLETGDGFLICRNVPIARTGKQEYLGTEVDKPERPTVTVIRPEEEVFSDAAIASFEGKPFTDDHPPVMLTPENAGQYEKGHVQNVRRGTGDFDGFVVADIHVHDAATISAIQNGKRQISCGYECEYEENPDGTLTQKNIRGNHVALVDVGRAGTKAAIMDADKTQAANPPERTRKPMSKVNAFLHLFGMAANGRSSEEIRQLAEDAAPVMDEDTAPEHEEENAPVPEEDAQPEGGEAPAVDDAARFESIDARLSKIEDLLSKLIPPQTEAEEAPEEEKDPLDVALETIGKEIKGEAEEEAAPADENPATAPGTEQNEETAAEAEEAHVVPAEEMDMKEAPADDEAAKGCGAMDAETARNVILQMRPVIAGISNEKERKAATDALLALVKRPTADSDAAKIAKAAQANAQVKAQSRPATDLDAIQKLYDARNPHKNREE